MLLSSHSPVVHNTGNVYIRCGRVLVAEIRAADDRTERQELLPLLYEPSNMTLSDRENLGFTFLPEKWEKWE